MAGFHRVNGRIFRNKNSLRLPDSLSLSLSLVRSTDEGASKKEGRERGGEGFLGVLRLPSCLFYRFRVSSFLL